LIISFFFFFSCCCYEFDKRRVAQLRTHPAQENGTQCFIHHTRPSVSPSTYFSRFCRRHVA
jgi:hypothetical protein